MKIHRSRESRHGLLAAAALALPMLALSGCESASSGHAPGLAGGQTLTPGITNYPLAYIKEPAPAPTSTTAPNTKTDIDARDLITSITGSDLYVRDSASAAGLETNVTQSITMGNGAVRDLDVSPDGSKIVFSLRLPLNPKLKNTDPKQPNWKIYQYDASAKTVTQLTTDDITSGHDVGAHYLPDGRIVFASTRQLATQSILLDEGRPQYQAVTDDRQAIHLSAARHECGRQQHASNQLQYQPRFRAFRSEQRADRVLALGIDQRRPDQLVSHQSGRIGAGALVRREQPRHRRQCRGHEQQRDSVPERAPARGRQVARDRPAVSRHAARRRPAPHRCQ